MQVYFDQIIYDTMLTLIVEASPIPPSEIPVTVSVTQRGRYLHP